ncbi:MAG: S8 family serine peptidase [Saprospiraceae bacterium]
MNHSRRALGVSILVVWLGLCFIGELNAQREMIVLFHTQSSVHFAQRSPQQGLRFLRSLGIRHNLALYEVDTSSVDTNALLAWVRHQPEVKAAQWNGEVSFRETPDDPFFFNQWDMDIIQAPDAWEHTTGGQTATGVPIVVAVMDSSFDTAHEDIRENLWYNEAETPDDNVDNDGNGYVDDRLGWDYFSNTPHIAPGDHGLSITGIIGASGNNGKGVAGINWNLQMMLFSFNQIADLMQAYEYVIDQRMRFNETNGAAGAFVVAANHSFGVNNTLCDNYPVWQAMLDHLGEAGVLSSAGVANTRYNVDISGDTPATCPSDYLIVSCNTDADDNLYTSSAYGPVSVDMGSPGEASYTVKPAGTYGLFGGNSAATPHVTGAIALLYSANVQVLTQQAIQQPAATARLIRDVLIRGVEQTPSLQNRTATGGRLNLANALSLLLDNYNSEPGPLAMTIVFPNPVTDKVMVRFVVPEYGTYEARLYNTLGQLVSQKTVIAEVNTILLFDMAVASLPAGAYQLQFGKGSTWVQQMVVKL